MNKFSPQDRIDHSRNFIIDRLQNSESAAEGAILPPPLKAGIRVPVVTNLRLLKVTRVSPNVEFTLAWTNVDQEPGIRVRQYNIFVQGILDNNNPTGPFSVFRSPANIVLIAPRGTPLTFTVQTQLTSGLTSDLSISPTISGRIE
jgi:hypothetical protein